LSVRCAVTIVGAVINRPAVKYYDSTLIFGEFVTFYCRADDIRPYVYAIKLSDKQEFCKLSKVDSLIIHLSDPVKYIENPGKKGKKE